MFYAVMATVAACGALDRIPILSLIWLLASSALLAFGLRPEGLANFLAFTQFGHLFIAGMMIHLITARRGTTTVWLVLSLCLAYSLFGRSDWARIPPYIYFAINAICVGRASASRRARSKLVFALPVSLHHWDGIGRPCGGDRTASIDRSYCSRSWQFGDCRTVSTVDRSARTACPGAAGQEDNAATLDGRLSARKQIYCREADGIISPHTVSHRMASRWA